MNWALALHGGAGNWADERVPQALEGLQRASEAARALLMQGGSALDAVCEAVRLLEDDSIFNAGTGSVLNGDGEAEMDACVMRGDDLGCGAVAALKRVRNPILVARSVMEQTQHVMLAGEGALRFARARGFTDYDPVTDTARAEYRKRSRQSAPGTVGAVALDRAGHLAAATSTGGVLFKIPGRIGDSALPGAGNYANAFAAVSATGQGELMIRALSARRIAALIETGMSAQHAVETTLAEMRASVGSDAGFIATGRDGSIGIAHDTRRMVHARCSEADPQICVAVAAGKR